MPDLSLSKVAIYTQGLTVRYGIIMVEKVIE